MRNVAARVLSVISDILILALIVMLLATVGARAIGFEPYAVLSGSMEPELPVGSVVYVHHADPESIEVGDFVTFRRGDSVATHQAYEVDADAQQIRTQGIANIDDNGNVIHDASPVAFSDVIGTPALCVPLLGFAIDAVSSPVGISIAVSVVALTIGLTLIISHAGRVSGERAADLSAVPGAFTKGRR